MTSGIKLIAGFSFFFFFKIRQGRPNTLILSKSRINIRAVLVSSIVGVDETPIEKKGIKMREQANVQTRTIQQTTGSLKTGSIS
jgi:hypothetical protein